MARPGCSTRSGRQMWRRPRLGASPSTSAPTRSTPAPTIGRSPSSTPPVTRRSPRCGPEVPIVVAVNKIDKPGADPSKVRGQLSEYGLVPEEYGGDTMFVDVSAREGTGIDDLLEAILLTADAALDLRANPVQ